MERNTQTDCTFCVFDNKIQVEHNMPVDCAQLDDAKGVPDVTVLQRGITESVAAQDNSVQIQAECASFGMHIVQHISLYLNVRLLASEKISKLNRNPRQLVLECQVPV